MVEKVVGMALTIVLLRMIIFWSRKRWEQVAETQREVVS